VRGQSWHGDLVSAFVAMGLLLFGSYKAFASSGWCDGYVAIEPDGSAGLHCDFNYCPGNPKPACTSGSATKTITYNQQDYAVNYAFCTCPDAQQLEDDCCHMILYTDGPIAGTGEATGSCLDVPPETCVGSGICHSVVTGQGHVLALCND
jgi:hypothetical protein